MPSPSGGGFNILQSLRAGQQRAQAEAQQYTQQQTASPAGASVDQTERTVALDSRGARRARR
ncbi:hypothetical protein ACFPK1_29775 [Actinomycetospora rhizophila]|uniref:Uncharacterized protein n=1 Tax=Actinomycetospora rhizophila TaxID=1416876 RepID=A0ABV9ZLU4_9PSEU